MDAGFQVGDKVFLVNSSHPLVDPAVELAEVLELHRDCAMIQREHGIMHVGLDGSIFLWGPNARAIKVSALNEKTQSRYTRLAGK
jgi:hypothetical protein